MNKCISDYHYQDDWRYWVDKPLQGTYIVLLDDLVLKNLSEYKRFGTLDEAITSAKHVSRALGQRIHILMDCGYIDEHS